MDFWLEFSLQRSALISWSGWFWNRPEIKDKINGIIDNRAFNNLNYKKRIRDLVDVAKGYLKAVGMPRRLYDRLVETIITLGLRAIHWYYSTRCGYEYVSIPFRFTRALHWTVLGTVDEAKIVENSWVEKLETLQDDQQICDIYYITCASILKDFINSNAEKMLDNAQLGRSRLASNEKWKFIACSVFTLASPEHLSEEKKIELISKHFIVFNVRKEYYLFSMSVKKGHVIAAHYYWQQLSSSEREEMIIDAVGFCLSPFHEDPRPSRFTDILVFLLSEVLEKGVEEFFSADYKRIQFLKFRIEILKSLIRSYGWERNFFPVFDRLRSEMTESSEYYSVLHCVINVLRESRMMGLDSKNTIYHQILFVVLSDGGFDRILDTDLSSKNNAKFLLKVFELFDLDVINMILEKYSDCRICFLREGKLKYAKLIKNEKFNLLREFMETVLRSEHELEWFRNCQIDNLYALIRERKFHLADNLLNVLGSSEDERKRIKHKMDFLSFTARFFIYKNLEFGEKILNWGFSDEKEKIEYINALNFPLLINWRKREPISHFLVIFWREHVDQDRFIVSLSEFLKWFFGSENANYRISNILSETLLKSFFKAIYEMSFRVRGKCFYAPKAFSVIDELMKLCVPLDDIAKLRKEITQNACEWLQDCICLDVDVADYDVEKYKCLGVLDFFLDWVVKYRAGSCKYKKKREFVESLLRTRDGLILFQFIVRRFFKCKDYICLWIEWAGGISKIEHLLDNMGLLSDNSMYFQGNFRYLKQMCEQFERGKKSLPTTVKHICS